MRDAADLDTGTIVLQAILELLLDGAVVPLLFHVDEVDDDQAGKVAKAQLPRYFLGCLEIRLESRILDRVLARRTTGVHIDGNQSFGLVDDDVAARLQSHLRLQHAIELCFDAGAGEDRMHVAIGLHHLCVARHQHLHEALASL